MVHDADVGGGGPICPLPGTVIAVHVAVGDSVVEGQLLMVVEAMKMEHKITAPADSVVAEVRFAVGDRVDTGDLLVALEHRPSDGESMTATGRGADPHRQLLGLLRRPPERRARDGRGWPDRRAHRRLAGRVDDADPQPDPGQAPGRAGSPERSSIRWNR